MQIGSRLRYLAMTLAMLAPAAAHAQMVNDPAEISSCLCLQQAVAALSADMSAKTQALDAVRRQLADLDRQLVQQRPLVQVNNPDSVARYKALLEQRDGVYQQSVGSVVTDADQAVARYNARVNEYNARCANRPFNSDVVARVQATLSCPPLQ
jgi:multidrug resistance efflux pump